MTHEQQAALNAHLAAKEAFKSLMATYDHDMTRIPTQELAMARARSAVAEARWAAVFP